MRRRPQQSSSKFIEERLRIRKSLDGRSFNMQGSLALILYQAAADGDTEVALEALSRGANPDGPYGQSYCELDAISPLQYAACSGKLRIVKALIEHGADVNLNGRNGYRAVHWAAERGMYRTLRYLLKHGARIDFVEEGDITPREVAEDAGQTKCAKLLRRYEKILRVDDLRKWSLRKKFPIWRLN